MSARKFAPKSEYAKKLLDPRWQKMRLKIFERDKFTCQCCGAEEKTLHAHHLFYRPGAEGPWDYEDDDIMTVCDECHEAEHAFMAQRNTNLIRSLARAGFRTYLEFDTLSDILHEMAESVLDRSREDDLVHMLRCHITRMRDRGAAT